MRKVLLTLTLAALLALPVAAQFGFGRGMAMDSTALLGNKSVQDELKLDDDQKKALKEANDEMQKGIRTAIEEKDFSSIGKIREEHAKSVKKVLDKLTEKQARRLMEIEVQVGTKAKNPKLFANAGVQKALKFTTKQKDTVKETISEMDKDFKELDDDAKGDFKKMAANFKKKNEMTQDVYAKITKTLEDDQKTAFEKLGGEKFELKMEFPGFKDRGKDKKKEEKKDDI